MAKNLARRWWVLALRGIAAISFGLLAIFMPTLGLYALVILFGAYALADGSFNLATALHAERDGRRWGGLIFEGIASVVAGVLTFIWPAITAVVLLLLIAGWAVVTGIAELVTAIRLRKQVKGEWLMALSGVLSIALGVLLFLYPGLGAIAMVLWIGVYAILFGALLLGLAIRLRVWARGPERRVPVGGGAPQPV